MPRYEENNTPNFVQKVILIILAFILPPLPVFLITKNIFQTPEFFISVILTILGHIPGVLFALYYILVEYPKTIARADDREGYIRINNEDEIRATNNANDEIHSQEHRGDEQETGKVILGNNASIGQEDSTSSQSDQRQQPPPNYEDIVGSSNGNTRDTKQLGDNKVQE